MKRFSVVLSVFLLATSCQWFDTEKISADTFYEEELKAISWDDVDKYPTFSNCAEDVEKQIQQSCFEKTFRERIYTDLAIRHIVTHRDIEDSIVLEVTISKEGVISNTNIEMDTLTATQIPLLRSWLLESVGSLPKTKEPAYKRGIPVETVFRLPILIKTTTD